MSGENRRYYRARANAVGLGETQTGKEQIGVTFDVLTEGAPERQLTYFGYFTDGAFDFTLKALRACGWTGDDLSAIVLTDLPNEVDLVVEDEEYEGKWRPKVQFVNAPGGLAMKTPLTGSKAKAFAASMRDRIRAFDAVSGTRPAAARAPASAGSRPVSAAAPRRGTGGGATAPEPPPLTDSDFRGAKYPNDDMPF